jgi:hypothetical protein
MYWTFCKNGEAYVAKNDMNKFLETAEELKFKGPQSDGIGLEVQNDESRMSGPVQNIEENESKYIIDTQTNTVDGIFNSVGVLDVGVIQIKEDHDIQKQQIVEKKGEPCKCKVCCKEFRTREAILKHTSNIHSGLTCTCKICGKAGI